MKPNLIPLVYQPKASPRYKAPSHGDQLPLNMDLLLFNHLKVLTKQLLELWSSRISLYTLLDFVVKKYLKEQVPSCYKEQSIEFLQLQAKLLKKPIKASKTTKARATNHLWLDILWIFSPPLLKESTKDVPVQVKEINTHHFIRCAIRFLDLMLWHFLQVAQMVASKTWHFGCTSSESEHLCYKPSLNIFPVCP